MSVVIVINGFQRKLQAKVEARTVANCECE